MQFDAVRRPSALIVIEVTKADALDPHSRPDER
jgi:hypothetical protein